MTIAPDPAPVMTTIPNVELVAVGEWDASTGPVTFTAKHLAAAVAALEDPAVHAPRLRVGHTPPTVSMQESAGGFADQPAFGRFTNLRLADNGTKIVADMVGVPGWLADVLPAAYPSRSIECYFDVTTAAGRKHDMVITSVALLGVSMPAVQTLEDLRVAFGAELPNGAEVTGTRVMATQGGPMPERVSASVTYTDVRRSFYEDFATEESGRYWWWCSDFIMQPPTVIADDDEGGLWAVPYTIKNDAVSWGDPVEVRIQYVEKGGGKVAAARLQTPGDRVFASARESRPTDRVRAATNIEGGSMTDEQRKALAVKHGLPETATEEELQAKLLADALAAQEPEPAPEPTPQPAPEPTPEPAPEPAGVAANKGVKTIDETELERLRTMAARGEEARAKQERDERDAFLVEAVRAGKFAPSRLEHWRTLYDADKDGTRATIDGLEKGLIPVSELGGAPSDTQEEQTVHASIMSSVHGVKTTSVKGA